MPNNTTPQGVLQGSTDSLVLWAIVNTLILEILKEMGYGYALQCTITGDKVKYIGCLFVDNTFYMLNDKTNKEEAVIANMQQMQNHLDGLTKATRGAVNPKKCFGG